MHVAKVISSILYTTYTVSSLHNGFLGQDATQLVSVWQQLDGNYDLNNEFFGETVSKTGKDGKFHKVRQCTCCG